MGIYEHESISRLPRLLVRGYRCNARYPNVGVTIESSIEYGVSPRFENARTRASFPAADDSFIRSLFVNFIFHFTTCVSYVELFRFILGAGAFCSRCSLVMKFLYISPSCNTFVDSVMRLYKSLLL